MKLGKILSHGYLQCGFLPLRIAFPTLATMLLGTTVHIPSTFLVSTFIDSINSYEQGLLQAGLNAKSDFSQDLQVKLVAIVSRFGGHELPTSSNLKELILQLATYHFQVKPLPATAAVNAGIPDFERPIWQSKTLADIHSLYMSMVATPAKVMAIIQELDVMTSGEQRILTYLTQMIGDMKAEELATFLRFVSGSSVCVGRKINVSFNNLTGLARQPITHTCDCLLELPLSYISYFDFKAEQFLLILSLHGPWTLSSYRDLHILQLTLMSIVAVSHSNLVVDIIILSVSCTWITTSVQLH